MRDSQSCAKAVPERAHLEQEFPSATVLCFDFFVKSLIFPDNEFIFVLSRFRGDVHISSELLH